MISIIIKYYKLELKSNKSHSFFRDKIKIDFTALVYFSRQTLFRNNSKQAQEVTKWLRKSKFISSKSKIYPINSKYLPSTLPLSLLQVDFPIMDNILNLRDSLFTEYIEKKDVGLYIFFRLFQVKKIKKENIIKINTKTNIFKINNELFLFVEKLNLHPQGYTPLIKYIFDKSIIDMIAESEIYSFNKKLEYYEKEVRNYINKNNLTFMNVQQSIQFDYAYNNSQFDLTLKTSKNYPPLNLLEVEYLFPNTIPQNLLDIEKDNQKIYFNNFSRYDDIDFDDEILDSNHNATEYITHDIEAYDQLKQCLDVPINEESFSKYLIKYYKLISDFKKKSKENYLFNIFEFTEILLKKADKEITKKPIKKQTLKEYLRIIFNYCFNYIILEGGLSKEVFNEIKENINIFENENLYKNNSNLTIRSTKKYYRLIKLFWKKYSDFKTETSLKMIVDIRRSVVFKKEIDSFIDILINEDSTLSSKNKKFTKLIRSAFCLILYYSGLRKTELRTLLSENMELVNEKEFEILITKKNFEAVSKINNELELKEKSDNAIRLVRFCIDDEKHLLIIKQYLKYIENKNIKFMFPAITRKGNIQKSKPVEKYYFDDLPKKLADHTKRYTPLHSLRHSYATFKTISLFIEEEHFLVYELSSLIGHSEPIVTILNYIHIDLLFLIKETGIHNQYPNLKSNYQLDLI